MRYEGFNHDWLYAYLDELAKMKKRGQKIEGQQQRFVIIRTVIHNEVDRLVARKLGKSISTIGNIRRRAFANLRKLMEKSLPAEMYINRQADDVMEESF